ncbi:hypothetical protein Q0F98_39905 [Paenibacillus amylolyticus]|nr:hypothetical protein Q0F98_39905 [Paenibacillus amylolyticus]
MLVYDAKLHWLTDSGIEIRSVSSWLQGGRDGSRNPGDVLISIHIPMRPSSLLNVDSGHRPAVREVSFYRKLGRRETFSASLVTVALYGEIDSDNRWTKIAIAAGGGSGMAMRLLESEQQLLGSEASVMQAATLAAAVASNLRLMVMHLQRNIIASRPQPTCLAPGYGRHFTNRLMGSSKGGEGSCC